MMSYEQFLLMKLAEEASEVSQIALKTIQFGMQEHCPGLSLNNKERIHEELNDLLGIVELLNRTMSFGFKVDNTAIDKKIIKVNKYLKYSVDLGKVSSDDIPI